MESRLSLSCAEALRVKAFQERRTQAEIIREALRVLDIEPFQDGN